MGTIERDPASYKDPLGHIVYSGSRVIRRLSAKGAQLWAEFSSSPLFESLAGKNLIVETRQLDERQFVDSDFPVAIEHERIPFISYPYEWSFEMLKDAALLTLDILMESLKHDFVLRDGSSFNVQFHKGRPVFIDILSFAPYKKEQMWIGYAQFCRMFLFPLMLASHKKIDYRPWIRGSIEGVSLDDMAGMFGLLDIHKRGVFFQVLLQHRLNKRSADKKSGNASSISAEKLYPVIEQLRSLVASLKNPRRETTWTEYDKTQSYGDEEKSAKEGFVEKACGAKKRGLVWDVGANIGRYSLIAARHAGMVLAIDSDQSAIDRLYRTTAKQGALNVLPILMDLADPSPGCGWMNRERKILTERGKPDFVIALALIHHLCIARNIELGSFVDWIIGLGGEGVVEFVSKGDPMVREMLSTREDVFDGYTKSNFESFLKSKADIKDVMEISKGKRTIYHYRSK